MEKFNVIPGFMLQSVSENRMGTILRFVSKYDRGLIMTLTMRDFISYVEELKDSVFVRELRAELRDLMEVKDELKKLKREKELEVERHNKMLSEHEVIFRNLKEDPECFTKALGAYNDVYNAISDTGESGAIEILENADVRCDSVSCNSYNTKDDSLTISLFKDYDESEKFLYDYINKRFGTNLDGSDIRTNTIFTVLHELGHYIDYSNKKKAGKFESYLDFICEKKKEVYSMEDTLESWKAYREMPSESKADKFAIEMMLKHFPELC